MKNPDRANSGVGFPETLWTVVSRAGAGSQRALGTLANSYRAPVQRLVIWFLRARNMDTHDPEDVTQEFFLHLLTHRSAVLGRADRSRGRFRAWFRTCLTNWLRTWADEVRAKKRGGGARIVGLDDNSASDWKLAGEEANIEKEFDRQWGLHVMEGAFRKLKEDEETGILEPGDYEIFRTKHEAEGPSCQEVATRLGKTVNTVVVSLRRSGRRLKEHLRTALVAGTASEDDLKREIVELLKAVGSS